MSAVRVAKALARVMLACLLLIAAMDLLTEKWYFLSLAIIAPSEVLKFSRDS